MPRWGTYTKPRIDRTRDDQFFRLDGQMAIVAGAGSLVLGDAKPRGRSKGKNKPRVTTPLMNPVLKAKESSRDFHERSQRKLKEKNQ